MQLFSSFDNVHDSGRTRTDETGTHIVIKCQPLFYDPAYIVYMSWTPRFLAVFARPGPVSGWL